jgi:hypothetical protein
MCVCVRALTWQPGIKTWSFSSGRSSILLSANPPPTPTLLRVLLLMVRVGVEGLPPLLPPPPLLPLLPLLAPFGASCVAR